MRRRRPAAQAAVRPDSVVIVNPAHRQDLSLIHVAEQLVVQELISHPRVETLAIAVFPRTSRLDVGGDHIYGGQPFPQFLRDELAAVVASQILGTASRQHGSGQDLDYVVAAPAALWNGRQAFMSAFVDDVEESYLLAVVCLVHNEIITPDVVPMFWTKTDATAVTKP